MSLHEPGALMFRILALREEINRVSSRLIRQDDGVFRDVSLAIPRVEPSELGFVRTISWLYVLYVEAGRVSVDFVTARFQAYGLDLDGKNVAHLDLTEKMRTYLQHNLSPTEPSNRLAQERCKAWFFEQSGTPVPGTDGQWSKCLINLLLDAVSFCENLLSCIRRIEEDESRDQIAREWDSRRRRYHAPHEFDQIIEIAAADMGREHIDAVRLRKRFYERWLKDLSSLDDDYEFSIEARKLIEQVLLLETVPVLPNAGNDIISSFGIPPSPQVGEWLDRARTLYAEQPCSREQLLERLRDTQAENA